MLILCVNNVILTCPPHLRKGIFLSALDITDHNMSSSSAQFALFNFPMHNELENCGYNFCFQANAVSLNPPLHSYYFLVFFLLYLHFALYFLIF